MTSINKELEDLIDEAKILINLADVVRRYGTIPSLSLDEVAYRIGRAVNNIKSKVGEDEN